MDKDGVIFRNRGQRLPVQGQPYRLARPDGIRFDRIAFEPNPVVKSGVDGLGRLGLNGTGIRLGSQNKDTLRFGYVVCLGQQLLLEKAVVILLLQSPTFQNKPDVV